MDRNELSGLLKNAREEKYHKDMCQIFDDFNVSVRLMTSSGIFDELVEARNTRMKKATDVLKARIEIDLQKVLNHG